MENFKHFVVTRFNVRTENPNWSNDKNNNPVLTDDWMRYRISIFQEYCLPSVLNQTCCNFEWIICLDTETSVQYKAYFDKLRTEHSFIVPIYADNMADFNKKYKAYIINNTNVHYVITSRLDNDDLVHKDYIRIIQEQFNDQKFQAINFTKILMISNMRKDKLFISYSFSNHFISLIEKINNQHIEGCYSRKDRAWGTIKSITHIVGKPYVMETINDKNLLNKFIGLPILKKTNLNDFALKGIYKNRLFDFDAIRLKNLGIRRLVRYIIFRINEH